MKRHAAIAAVLLALAALLAARIVTDLPKPEQSAIRYRAGPGIGYTYGPLDELRLDVAYVPSPDGPYAGVPDTGFTDHGRYYAPIGVSYDEDAIVVTYAERPASEKPDEMNHASIVAASACAAMSLLMGIAVLAASIGIHKKR